VKIIFWNHLKSYEIFTRGCSKKPALNPTIIDHFTVRDIGILVVKVVFPNATDNESVKQLNECFSCKKVKDVSFSPQIRAIQEYNLDIVQQGSKTALYFLRDGNVLGTEAASGGVSFDPSEFPSPTAAATTSPSTETTKIQVRMLDGKPEVINIVLNASVEQLAHAVHASNATCFFTPFRIMSGLPPKLLSDRAETIEKADIKGGNI
jgi:hypothetical protein